MIKSYLMDNFRIDMMHKTMDGIIIGVRLKRRELQYSLVIYYPAIYHQRDLQEDSTHLLAQV